MDKLRQSEGLEAAGLALGKSLRRSGLGALVIAAGSSPLAGVQAVLPSFLLMEEGIKTCCHHHLQLRLFSSSVRFTVGNNCWVGVLQLAALRGKAGVWGSCGFPSAPSGSVRSQWG